MKKVLTIFLALSIITLVGCTKTPRIQLGDIVTFGYTGTLENGNIFETGIKTITVGSGEIIKGIEQRLINKKLNQTITITVDPKDGYGYLYSINNQQRVSAFILEKLGIPLETGTLVTLDKIHGKILKQESDKQGNPLIVIDVNPEQTRQKTSYKISITSIQKSTTKEGYQL